MTPPSSWSRCPFCGTRLDPTQTACPQCGAAPSAAVTVGYDERRPTTPAELQALETELRDALAPRLQLLRLLGQGGMGSVFLARDPALRRLVVVKVLSPSVANDPVARARFAREAETAASVAHPNVVHVYQVGTLDRSATTYFTMQFVDGMTLEQAYPPDTPVPEPVAKRIMGEIASALAAAHARELIHRDIKPANVMIDRESGRALVLDFGISAAKRPDGVPGDARATVEGMVVGTPAYLSPEQAAGEPSIDRSDIYSLGVVMFELVTGRAPFLGTTPMALVAAHLRDIPRPVAMIRPELDPQFAGLIDQCLRKEAAARPTAESIARYLAPPTQALIEWPPPGLDQLHRYGWEHLRLLWIAAVIGLAEMLLFAAQPETATGAWQAGANGAWALLGGQGSEVFAFTLIVLFLAPAFLTIGVLARSLMLAARMRQGRVAGYPWPVLLDVACDHWEETAALLNRQGPFALLAPSDRDRMLRRRRLGLILVAIAPALGVVGPVLWWNGLLPLDQTDNFAVISPSGLLIVLLLPLLPVGVAMLLGFQELKLIRRARRRTGALAPRPIVRTEVVAAWMSASGRPGPSRAFLPILPGLGVAFLSVALVLATLVVVAEPLPVYVNTSSMVGRYARETAEDFLRERMSNRELTHWWARAESVLLLNRPPATVSVDSGVRAARRLLKLALVGTVSDVWATDAATSEELEQRFPGSRDGGIRGSWWTLVPGHLPRMATATLERRIRAPRTTLADLVASAGPLPRGWSLATHGGTLAACSCTALDPRQLARIGSIMASPFTDLEAATLLALDRRDHRAAVAATQRAAAYALALMGEPFAPVAEVGTVGLGRVRRMAAQVAELSGDVGMRHLATELDWVITAHRATTSVWGSGENKLMSDPVRPAGLAALQDHDLLPATRVQLFEGVVGGICQNPREVLFGPTPARRLLLDTAAEAISDLPEAGDLVAWQRRRLARIDQMDQGARKSACTFGAPPL